MKNLPVFVGKNNRSKCAAFRCCIYFCCSYYDYECSPAINDREQLLSAVGEKEEKIYSLQHRVSELERLIFGVKSERFVATTTDPKQGNLDFGSHIEQKKEDPTLETITYTREKNKGNKKPSRQVLPSHLPRIEHIIEPDEDITGLVKIGAEVTEELEYSPGKLFVKRYVRPKYIKPTEQGNKIIIAPMRSVCYLNVWQGHRCFLH